MKKTILTLTLFLFVLVLTACNSSTSEATAEDDAGNAAPEGEREFTMPTEMQLMLGTVKLDETEYAVDAEQASELLPLWKALRSLSESETAAQTELEALINQIAETMTPEQAEAIESMELSMQDMNTVMEALGIESNFGGFGEMDEEMKATMEAARESGEAPAGGPPGGGMGPEGGMGPGEGMGPGGEFGGAEMDPTARETAMAERGGARGAGVGVNTAFLDALIEFLEAKIQ
jgi:hypothetical protein